jgi:cysteine synthase A
VTRELLSAVPDVLRVGVEPAESAVLSGGERGTHHIEGGGAGFWPPLLKKDDLDEVIPVSDAEAFAIARRAASEEGLISGPSTGANLTAAVALARRLGLGKRIVTAQVDSGLKYLAGSLYAG